MRVCRRPNRMLTAAKHAGWARFGLIVLALGLEGA